MSQLLHHSFNTFSQKQKSQITNTNQKPNQKHNQKQKSQIINTNQKPKSLNTNQKHISNFSNLVYSITRQEPNGKKKKKSHEKLIR